jgi:hypothetical protein
MLYFRGKVGCELPADTDLTGDNTFVTDVVLRDTLRNNPCVNLSAESVMKFSQIFMKNMSII